MSKANATNKATQATVSGREMTLHTDFATEEMIAEWRRLYAAGALPAWQIKRIERVPGWSWNETGGAA
jgi:hypothetical protein